MKSSHTYDYSKRNPYPFHASVSRGDFEKCKAFVEAAALEGSGKLKETLTQRNEDGWTPLHLAASRGRLNVVQLLVEHGADVNCKSMGKEFGKMPLHFACGKKHDTVASFLLRSKAEISGHWDYTEVKHLLRTDNVCLKQLLMRFVELGEVIAVIVVLSHRKDIENVKEALEIATSKNNTPMIALLSAIIKDVERKPGEASKALRSLHSQDMSALHIATMLDLARTVKFMIEEEKGININVLNNNGKRALKVAETLMKRLGTHQKVVHLLSEMTTVKKREDNEEKRYQELLEQLKETGGEANSISQHYIQDQRELRSRLIELTEPNELVDLFHKLEVLSPFMAFVEKPKSSASLSESNGHTKPAILELIVPPQNLLDFNAQESRFTLPWKKKDALAADHPLFHRINTLLSNIKSVQAKLPNTEKCLEAKDLLDKIARFYKNYVNSLCAAPSPRRKELFLEKPVAKISSIGQRFLSSELAKALERMDDPKRVDPYQGSHTVFCLGHVHFKLNPHSPGVEYTVNTLGNLIAGQGTIPTELVSVDFPNSKRYVMLASKSVEGLNLHHVLAVRPELLEKINPYNFSAVVILSLLTDPQDGKPDNYIVRFNIDKDSDLIQNAEIVGVDNDITFAEPVVKCHTSEANSKYVSVKCVLYFLSLMNQKIDKEFRDFFLHLSPEVTIIKWLASCRTKNREYADMIKRKIITDEEAKRLRLPIFFTQPLATLIYEKMNIIQEMIQDEDNLPTLKEIFHKVEPDVAKFYEDIAQRFPNDPLKSIFKVYQKASSTPEERKRLKREISKRSTIQSELAKMQAKQYDFLDKRALPPEDALEHFIYTIDFSKLPIYSQLEALACIMHHSMLHTLSFNGLDVLDGARLLEFANKEQFPKLEKLVLVNCKKVYCKDLINLLSSRPELQLVLGPCPNITRAEWARLAKHSEGNWQLLVFNKQGGSDRASIALPINKSAVSESLRQVLFCGILNFDLLEFLLEQGADLNAPDENEDTPLVGCSSLHFAVKNGFVGAASYLLWRGADVNFQNPVTGDTALLYAARRGHINMIRILLNHGAKTDLTDKRGITPLGYTLKYYKLAAACYLAARITRPEIGKLPDHVVNSLPALHPYELIEPDVELSSDEEEHQRIEEND